MSDSSVVAADEPLSRVAQQIPRLGLGLRGAKVKLIDATRIHPRHPLGRHGIRQGQDSTKSQAK